MSRAHKIVVQVTILAVLTLQGFELSAQEPTSGRERRRARRENQAQRPDPAQQRYRVEGGRMVKTDAPAIVDSAAVAADSTNLSSLAATDSLLLSTPDSTVIIRDSAIADSLSTAKNDSMAVGTLVAQLSRRDIRRQELAARKADSTLTRHHFFRDSIPISRLTSLSIVIPGLSQFYNKQPWKIPILYGTVAAGIYFGMKENKNYSFYKKQYDKLVRVMPNRPTAGSAYDPEAFARWRAAVDPIQDKMIRHNTNRQILLGGALASYIYFIGDGAVNYPGQLTRVKKATTLSTICPGAGQVYNGSYWKVPIVVGGIATFAYVIDWNNRGYKRFKTAYDLISETGMDYDKRIDEFKDYRNLSHESIKKYKDSFRRNRDLCIILACGFYILNIIDAHVDAHLRDYDISDDLAFSVAPSITPFHMASTGTSANLYGVSLGFSF